MKKALVTGGSGGMGKVIAVELLGDYEVFAPDLPELDVTNRAQIDAFFDQNGPLDLIVNCAGMIHPLMVIESDPEKWINDVQVNLIAPYLISHAALNANPNVTIINIASTAGYAAYKEWSSYCASKAAVITLTKSMANEGVRAFAISPGATDTQFRDYFDLPNENMMSPIRIAELVREIIDGKYDPGVSLFVRKDEFEIR
jgi:NAD(P)-dependent dehydrogenase (short-subunit alcohol dehydrogenase family)